jgi:hypothetical protein
VLFVWAVALAAALLAPAAAPRASRAQALRALAFVLVIALLALVRHNAVVVLPVAALVLWCARPDARVGPRLLVALAPALLFLLADATIARVWHVRPEHIERHLMASDLAGLVARDPATLPSLHYLGPFLLVPVDELRARYVPGEIETGIWSPAMLADPVALRRDYRQAWMRHPLALAVIKAQAFARTLGFPRPHLFIYYPQVEPNEYGLAFHPAHAALRAAWGGLTLALGTTEAWRFVFGEHWVWVAIALGWLGFALASPRRRVLALPLALPLAYHLSYLLAAPADDYRLMYPATLVVQVVTVAWLVDRATRPLAAWLRSRRRALPEAARALPPRR